MSTSDTVTYSSPASCIGDRIRRIRTERGMSRAELGEKIGLCQNRVQQYENGRRKPKAPLLEKIAKALSVNIFALDPVPTSTLGVMHTFFELEENFGAIIAEGSDGHSIALSFDSQNELYNHLKRWLLEYETLQAQLNAAFSDDERAEFIKEYHEWKWNYPCNLNTSEKIAKKNRIKKKIEELQEIYNHLDEA